MELLGSPIRFGHPWYVSWTASRVGVVAGRMLEHGPCDLAFAYDHGIGAELAEMSDLGVEMGVINDLDRWLSSDRSEANGSEDAAEQ